GRADFDEVRRTHDLLLHAAIESSGGTVVKGLGDGVMATFSSAKSGVTAARAIQQAVHRHNRRGRGPELSLRVGISVGDVTFDGLDCFGAPVIEAARLCALADGDQILATDVLRVMARDTAFRSVGALALKGLPEPVDTVEIEWDRVQASDAPLPARLAVDAPEFVGRTDVLEVLNTAYERVRRTGQRSVLLIGGEPGGGKTTVVSRAVRAWHDDGATVAMGRCEEDVRAPYRPMIEALDHIVGNARADLLDAHAQRHGAGVLPLAPSLARRLPKLADPISTDPESERFLLFSAVGDLLCTVGAEDPVVLFLDDLHWADAATASLLRSIATAPEPARLLVVGTFRDAELAPDHPMAQALAAFRRVPCVERLTLDGLDAGEVTELLTKWTGASASAGTAQLAEGLVAETDGNAFFVTEVIRHLDATGQLEDLAAKGALGGAVTLPDSVLEVLAERVGRLGTAAEEILGAAAVIGLEFELPLVSGVTGTSDEKVLSVLHDATSAALVLEVHDAPGRFQFTHALVQHAILTNLGPTREVSLHRRVAEFLEQAGTREASVAELARHWLQATRVSDTARARDSARQAGEAALDALAPGDAVAYFRQALLLHEQSPRPDAATRIDLLTQLGTAERLSGDPEHRETLLRACRLAQRENDGARLATAALANNVGTFSTFGGVDVERVETLEAAVAVATNPQQRALLLGTLANELTYSGNYPRRRQIADAALEAARATGDRLLVVRVMNMIFYPLWVPETLAERVALTEESRAIVATTDDPLVLFWSGISNYLNLVQAGRVEEADEILHETQPLADRLAQPALQWRSAHRIACRHMLGGNADAAEEFARRAFDYGEQAGDAAAVVYFKSQTMCVHWMRGTLHELGAGIKGDSPRPATAVASLVLIFTDSGRLDDVRRLLDREAANGFTNLARDPAYVTSMALFAEGAVATRHHEAAELLHQLLLPFADQIGFDGVTTVGGLEHYLGALAASLGRYDEAVERLERSAALHERINAPFFEARSRLQLADALAARAHDDDAARAQLALARAGVLAKRHGFALIGERTRALAASLTGG
ncbi:MAG TPA: AAA family ATPase, partial [Acidimicrobiales bacterium]|nr:AAA family ATPase [Acidimicrobiales bacterium]